MMLNKEECEFALQRLYSLMHGATNLYPIRNKETILNLITNDRELLEQLIEEHFDNKVTDFDNLPLKFEELEKGVPVWNSIIDCWVIPIEIDKNYKRIGYIYYFDKNDDSAYGDDDFEENRFYRREVEA